MGDQESKIKLEYTVEPSQDHKDLVKLCISENKELEAKVSTVSIQ